MTQAFEDTRNSILRYITRRIEREGAPPSQREIARACFLAQGSVRYHLRVLARQGRIELTPRQARGIRLTEGA